MIFKGADEIMNCMIIDIGSNTVKCDVFSVSDNGFKKIFHKSKVLGFLSCLTDGILSEKGYLALLCILSDYKSEAEKLGCSKIFPFATASFRSCRDPYTLIDRIRDDIGLEITLFSGQTEGQMSFLGVMHSHREANDGVTFDMGGGSLEVNVFADRRSIFLKSLPFGALYMKNRFAPRNYSEEGLSAFATKDEIASIYNCAREISLSHSLPVLDGKCGFIVGGSARAIGLLCGKPDELGIVRFSYDRLCEIIEEYSFIDREKADYLISAMPDRYQLVIPAASAYRAVFDLMNVKDITVAIGGIKEGYMSHLISNGTIK